ncbi:integrase family domain protein [Mycobacterium xenopi 4042]|uniref:Integrase family domain protein n=1 Tax=Mycobacterium xenopi 4042 TaxID=1299334 RepID=X7ZB94_MYCXE|nr:integrase family domain protein [Mycobacterium xenopi 4042]
MAALAGLTPERLTQPVIDAQRKALAAAITRHRPGSHGVKALSAALFGAQTTLFHLGVIDTAPAKPTRTARPSAPPSGRRSRHGWRPR